MGNQDRIYLKFEGLDWDDDQAIDTFARSLHSGLVDLMNANKKFCSQERDENEGVIVRVSKDK